MRNIKGCLSPSRQEREEEQNEDSGLTRKTVLHDYLDVSARKWMLILASHYQMPSFALFAALREALLIRSREIPRLVLSMPVSKSREEG